MIRCELAMFPDGGVSVHWRATLDGDSTVRRIVLGFRAEGVQDVSCDGDGVAASTTGHVGNRVRIVIAFDAPAGHSGARVVRVSYKFRAGSVPHVPDGYRLDSSALPRVLKTEPAWLGLAPSIVVDRPFHTAAVSHLELKWPPMIKCFGLAQAAMTGHAVGSLTQAEWDDLEIQFGRFVLGLRAADEEIWLPESEVNRWSSDDLQVVLTWLRKSRSCLTNAFGVAPRPVKQVLLTGRDGALSQYFSNTVWISYQHPPGAPWTNWAMAWLVMKLLHELSHAWWVPATNPYADRRAWSLAEAVATLCQYALLSELFEEHVVSQVWTQKASRGAVYLATNFTRHRELVPGATSGLRAGYALSALFDPRGSLLIDLRRLLDLMQTADPTAGTFEGLVRRTTGPELGEFLLDVLAEPQPPLASLRVSPRSGAEPEASVLFGRKAAAERFARRLRLSSLGKNRLRDIRLSGSSVVLTFVANCEPRLLLGRLSPGFLVDRRILQEASTSPLVAAVRKQAEFFAARSVPTSATDRIRRFALGLLAVGLMTDAPVGYKLVADALDGRMDPLASRARDAALARAAW